MLTRPSRPHGHVALAIALALAFAQGACARREAAPASRGVDAWRDALRADDPARAYALLTRARRAQLTFATFRAAWAASRAERLAAAEELARPPGPQIDERATITLADGASIELVREGDAWRHAAPLTAGLVARTPMAALARLEAALGGESAEALLRLISSRRREPLRELLSAFRRGLRERARDAIELSPERALLEWTDGAVRYRVDLVREGTDWRVDDVRLP